MKLASQRFPDTLSASSLLPEPLTLGPGSATAVENLDVCLLILGMLDQVPAPGLFVGFPESSFHYGQIDGKIMQWPFLDGLFYCMHGVVPLSKKAV